MTPGQIDQLAAGAELDALIAEKVMGWKNEGRGWINAEGKYTALVEYCFSTCISGTWEVVEKLKPLRLHLIDRTDYEAGENCWEAYLLDTKYGPHHPHSKGETAPLAICRAALKAVMRGQS